MFHPQGPTFWELARQALSSTERGYDLLAPKFDFTPFRTPDAVLNIAASLVGRSGPVDAALDVCCGTGAAVSAFRPMCRRRIVGIDFSQGMLDVARGRIPDVPGAATVEWVRGDVLDMPFQAEFDLAVSFGACGHFLPAAQPRLIDQIARALKSGGRFVFVSSYAPRRGSASYWLARGFNAAMHLRNAVWRPPFIMFYLTFLIPEARQMLARHGFSVELDENVFPPPFQHLHLLTATKLG